MENILNVVSIFGHKIDWELDTALFWLFIVQAALVVFLVIVFAVLLHRVGKNKSTVIVQTAAETADKDAPKEEEQKLDEHAPVADETPAETKGATDETPADTKGAADETPAETKGATDETPAETNDKADEAPAEAEEEAKEDAKPAEEGSAAEEDEKLPPAEESKDGASETSETDTVCEEQPGGEQADVAEQEPEAEQKAEAEQEAPEETPEAEEAKPEEEQEREVEAEASADDDAQQDEQEDASCGAAESDDEDALADEEGPDDGILRYNKSFTARLILSDDEVKTWYAKLKNEFLSYKKVKSRMSWKRETFRLGRNVVASLGFRGHTLCVYLPLSPADYEQSKYKIEDVSEQVTYADTPCMYRLKNQKRVRYAEELFVAVMEKMGGLRIDRAAEEYDLPYESLEELVAKGLVKCVVKNSADEAIFLHNAQQEQPSVAPAEAEETSSAERARENAECEEETRIEAAQPSLEQPAETPVEPSVADSADEAAADDEGAEGDQGADDLDAYASDAEAADGDEPGDDAETAQNDEEQLPPEEESPSNGTAQQLRWNGKNRKKHRSHR